LKIPLQLEKKFLEKFYKIWGIVYFLVMEISMNSYRRKVDWYTNQNLNYKGIIVPEGMTIDHKFPVSFGYRLNVPPEYIADLRNIQFLPLKENISKGYRCKFIPFYIQQYLLGIVELVINRDSKEMRMKGIKRAKELGIYTGRKVGTSESPELFFEKVKIKKIVELKKLGWRHNRISKEVGVSINTITKVNKMMEKYPHLVK
jgi:hypothetical protein